MSLRLSPLWAAAVYYGLTLILVTAVALTGGSTAIAMTVPVVAALVLLLVVTREGWSRAGWASLGLHRAGLRTWPVALAVPLAVNVLAGFALVVTGAATWDPTGQPAVVSPWLWAGVLLVNVAFASVTVSLTEEVGWRGYLLPRLAALGTRRALLLSGLMHGVWHLPVILLTDLYLTDASLVTVVPMFLACVTASGVFTGWLRLRTGSVWPAVIAHSAHNVAVSWVAEGLAGDPGRMELVGGESGIVVVAAYVTVALILLRRPGAELGVPGAAADVGAPPRSPAAVR